MLEIVPYEFEDIKKELKTKAITEYGLTDAQYEGSNISQIIELIAYATLINNTNFTFGLNEMFITQASSRSNVIKHAIQMGFNFQRKTSYEYRIKLKVKKAGEVLLNKYSTFKSNTNNYIYLGDTIVDTYGTYIHINPLTNENNNGLENLYNSIEEGTYIISEEGNIAKVLKTEKEGVIKFLLEPYDFEVKEYSNLPKDIYVWDGTYSVGYRNFIKVGTLDTYIYDEDLKVLKVQITENTDIQFPLPIETQESNKNIVDNGDGTYSLEEDVEFLINTVKELKVNDVIIDLSKVTSESKNIIIESNEDLSSYTADVTYDYIIDNFGLLARRIFFSDLRGENKDNEQQWSDSFTNGWNGFYASEYNSETNILYFPIGEAPQELIDAGVTSGRDYHNPYVTNDLKEVLNTPFKRLRFSPTEEDSNYESGYTPYDNTKVFGDVLETFKKDTLEIIVKEGYLKRYNELTEASKKEIQYANENNLPLPEPIFKYPELTFNINTDMVNAGYFTLKDESIEDNGIEMFVTRSMPDGSIEYDILWKKRTYLVAEKTNYNSRTYVAISDGGYEDYINVHTAYAGTGTPLSEDMIIKLNLLITKGKDGYTKELIEPEFEDFEAIWYNETNLIPHITHIEGADAMSTDEIRLNAPLFSNTANRAVTKKDYKTICESQQFISTAQVWGGEELIPIKKPGEVFISVVPMSKSNQYITSNLNYKLNGVEYNELFYPSYYQITGQNNYYSSRNIDDDNVLFNILDNYKIITLKLNYIKTLYLDYTLDIKVLKYKFGDTIESTNNKIFEALKGFFEDDIQKYNSTFYKSSLIRYIDKVLGDEYGLDVNINTTIDIYDKLYNSDEGLFVNKTKKSLTPNNEGIVGSDDLFTFEIPLKYPIEDLFEDNIIENNVIKYKGSIITNNLTNINTDNFIMEGDRVFLELNEEDMISYNLDDEIETEKPSSYSKDIIIKVIYTKNYNNFKEYNGKINDNTGELYTKDELIAKNALGYEVGVYFLSNEDKEIKLNLYSHLYDNMNGYARVQIDDIGTNYYDEDGNELTYLEEDLNKRMYYLKDGDDYVIYDNQRAINITGESDNYDIISVPYIDKREYNRTIKDEYFYIKASFDRNDFISYKKLSINPKNDNIINIKNVYSRLKEVKFDI